MIPFSVLYGVSNQCNHLEKVYLGTEEAKTFVAATVFEKTVVHLAKDFIYTMLTQRRSQSQLLISQNPTVIEYTMISRRVRSLFSSSRSWSRRFSLIIWQKDSKKKKRFNTREKYSKHSCVMHVKRSVWNVFLPQEDIFNTLGAIGVVIANAFFHFSSFGSKRNLDSYKLL